MFLIAVATALVFIKLGALFVWVDVLSLTLKAMLATVFAVALTCRDLPAPLFLLDFQCVHFKLS